MRRDLEEIRLIFETAKGIRSPEDHALGVYKNLVHNRFEDLIRTSFPKFSDLVDEELPTMVDEFLKVKHSSPLLLHVTKEFLDFFKAQSFPVKSKYPFLEDLLLHEWLEIHLFNLPEDGERAEFSWDFSLRLSRTSVLTDLSYPVHKIGGLSADDVIRKKGSYYLLTYRGFSEEVKSVELTEFVYTFLRDIDGGMTPISALKEKKLGEEEDFVKSYLEKFLRELCDLGVMVKR